MTRLRKIHFVIHNQGAYDFNKKEQLLILLKSKYGENLEAYLIAQEVYTHDKEDTHLQGNLFFKNAIHFSALLKLLKSKYKEEKTPQGLKYRTDLSAVVHEGRAYNYMMNDNKDGGDKDPLNEMTNLDKRRKADQEDRHMRYVMDSLLFLQNQTQNMREHNKQFFNTGIGSYWEFEDIRKQYKDMCNNNPYPL